MSLVKERIEHYRKLVETYEECRQTLNPYYIRKVSQGIGKARKECYDLLEGLSSDISGYKMKLAKYRMYYKKLMESGNKGT